MNNHYLEVKGYIYQCYECNKIETNESLVDGKSCCECKQHTRMIALIKKNNKVVLVNPSNESLRNEKKKVVKLKEKLNVYGQTFDKVNHMKRLLNEIDETLSTMTGTTRSLQTRLTMLTGNIMRTNETLLNLLSDNSYNQSDVELLADSIKDEDEEILKLTEELHTHKAKYINRLVERNKLKLKLDTITADLI